MKFRIFSLILVVVVILGLYVAFGDENFNQGSGQYNSAPASGPAMDFSGMKQ